MSRLSRRRNQWCSIALLSRRGPIGWCYSVDVSKETADLTLLNSDLGLKCHTYRCDTGVLGWRRTFSNIITYIMMGISTNFGNIFSMTSAALFLPMLPIQILLNNILYDVRDANSSGQSRSWRAPQTKRIRYKLYTKLHADAWFCRLNVWFRNLYVTLAALKSYEAWFQIGWFMESLSCTGDLHYKWN